MNSARHFLFLSFFFFFQEKLAIIERNQEIHWEKAIQCGDPADSDEDNSDKMTVIHPQLMIYSAITHCSLVKTSVVPSVLSLFESTAGKCRTTKLHI